MMNDDIFYVLQGHDIIDQRNNLNVDKEFLKGLLVDKKTGKSLMGKAGRGIDNKKITWTPFKYKALDEK